MQNKQLSPCQKRKLKVNPIRYLLSQGAYHFIRAKRALFGEPSFHREQIEFTQHQIPIPNLGKEFDGFRLVQISDFHYGTWLNAARIQGIIPLVNQQKPDVIILSGDFISHLTIDKFAELIGYLNLLTPKEMMLATRGNHDCWIKPTHFFRTLRSAGIIVLNNRIHTLTRKGQTLHFCGLDTAYYLKDRLGVVLNRIPKQGSAILLTHEPDSAETNALSKRFAMQLSGHTHGGQIVFPIIGAPWKPCLGRKYPSGAHKVGDMFLYTNRGIGTSTLPIRVACPPEVSIFILHSI